MAMQGELADLLLDTAAVVWVLFLESDSSAEDADPPSRISFSVCKLRVSFGVYLLEQHIASLFLAYFPSTCMKKRDSFGDPSDRHSAMPCPSSCLSNPSDYGSIESWKEIENWRTTKPVTWNGHKRKGAGSELRSAQLPFQFRRKKSKSGVLKHYKRFKEKSVKCIWYYIYPSKRSNQRWWKIV